MKLFASGYANERMRMFSVCFKRDGKVEAFFIFFFFKSSSSVHGFVRQETPTEFERTGKINEEKYAR